MNDTISRQAAIDAVHKAGITEYDETLAIEEIERVPSVQSEEAIPTAWLEEQAKWFESMDNAFAKIEANNIRTMIKKWRRENGRHDQQTGGD